MTDIQQAVNRLIPRRTPPASRGTGTAPANIALCKYWGKRNQELKLPLTGSLSISLADLGTTTTLEPADTDRFVLNGTEQDPASTACQRLFSFVDLFREPGTPLLVTSTNTIPMAAGLASSASGFAALVLALNDLYRWNLDLRSLSILARLGSGSAARSLEHGFVEWLPGEAEDGQDSYAERLDITWPGFRVGILTLSESEKPVGSTEGMKRTRETSRLYASWPDEVAHALPRIRQAVFDQDFTVLGATAEQNALSMHATMIASWPPILYWQPETVHTLHQVHALRRRGVEVYATLDAGPNVKLLFLQDQEEALTTAFPGLRVVSPFRPHSI